MSKAYSLTGPEAIDHTRIAGIIAKVSGKPIAYHPLSEEAMLQGMRETGMPESAVEYVGVLYGAVRAGYTAAITSDVETVTGNKPQTFEAFAAQHAAFWA